MRIRRTCKEVTHLALQALEQPLPWSDRLAVRLHLWVCKLCPPFMRQLALMQRATGQWRRYSEQSLDD
ncbi:zf-HC2 domain-containing protein [Burkholderiaceae bacterium UC74_6]